MATDFDIVCAMNFSDHDEHATHGREGSASNPDGSGDFPSICRRIAIGYFLAQGVGVLSWWAVIFARPEYQPLFFPMNAPAWLVSSFALPDILLAGVGSLATAHAIRRRVRSAPYLAGMVTSCLTYATLLCISWTVVGRCAPLGTGMMILCSLLSAHASTLASGTSLNIFVAYRGSRPLAAFETFLQIMVFWGLFLGALPLLFAAGQDEMGLARFSFPGQFILATFLFAAFGALGVWSAAMLVRDGRGTPLPMREARDLVCTGPYSRVRNPMAIAGLGQGVAMAIGHGTVLYIGVCLCGALIWHVLIRPVEEVHLLRLFGDSYERYRGRVRCWWIARRAEQNP